MALSLRTLFRGTRVGLITQMQKCQQAMNHTSWRFLETRPSSCSSQASAARIFAVDVRDKDLVITWRDDDKLDSLTAKMPYSYLRDNSHLSQSRARSHGHAYLKSADFGTNIAAKHVGIGEDGQQLTITWSDGYRGCFRSSWLLQHRTGTGAVSSRLPVERNLWDSSSFSSTLLQCDYEDVMSSDSTLLDCILTLESCGIVMIENAGLQPRQAVSLCDRIAYPKPVVYGYDVMKLEAIPNAPSLAYTNIQIPLHTDMPYCEYVPGILLLHCIHQVEEGGLTLCCDGFHVAEQLRERSPDAFEMLSRYPIQFRDAADDYVGHNIDAMQRPIRLDSMGDIVAIRHNNGVRGSRFPDELMGQLYEWYDAYYKFSNLMYDPEFLVEFKLQPGQIAVFDNTRILHGRSGFDMGEGTYQYLEEVYLDWDEACSKARVLMGQGM